MEESTGQHPDEIKINSPQLDEEFKKFICLKDIIIERVGGNSRFHEIESELLEIKRRYNLTPTTLKDIVNSSLMEDELLHTLKKY